MMLKWTSSVFWSLSILCLGCVMALYPQSLSSAESTAPSSSRHPVNDIRLFYEKLTPYGNWKSLDPHGWVWVPRSMSSDWRPYTEGRWIYTEAGLTWVSEQPWGWGPFHYGRWWFSTPDGWVWIPGTVWAPAWVAWRVGQEWIGWAPLPPQVSWDPKVGLSTDRIDLVAIEPSHYVFVPAREFLEPGLQKHLAAPAGHDVFWTSTRNVTTYLPMENRAQNHSLSVEQVVQLVGHAVPQHRLQDLDAASTDIRSQVKGKELVMFRPILSQSPPGLALPLPEPAAAPVLPQAPQPQEPTSEQRILAERLAVERARLIARQEREMDLLLSKGYTLEDILQQQERERRAFEIDAERERQRLANRLKQQRRKPRFWLEYDERGDLRSLYE